MEQRSPEWFAARRGRVTGSQVGALLDLSPYRSKDAAFRDLVRSIHDMPSEFEGNVATEWGNANESLARTTYEMETGNAVEDASFVEFDTWLGASPDGWVAYGLVEFKCPFGIRKDKNPVFKSIEDQPHYYAQIQLQLFVTKRSWCDFFQWTPFGWSLERVTYDGAWINENLPTLRAIWEDAKAADPALYEGPARPVFDTPETDRLISEYDELSEAIENAEARKKDIVSRLVEISGGKNAVMSGRNLTLVKRKGSVSYAKALAKYAPDADLEPFRGKDSESWQVK